MENNVQTPVTSKKKSPVIFIILGIIFTLSILILPFIPVLTYEVKTESYLERKYNKLSNSQMVASVSGIRGLISHKNHIPLEKIFGLKIKDKCQINGQVYEVKAISDKAFQNANIKKITLPSTIKYIGDYAFEGNNFKEIVIPEGTEYLGYNVFKDCKQLENVTFPSTLKYMGSAPLLGCDNYNAPNYSINYELDGGINSKNNPTSFTLKDSIYIDTPKKEGFIFDGWYYDAEFIQKLDSLLYLNQDTTLYAKWLTTSYIIYLYVDNKEYKDVTVYYNQSFELPVLEKVGHHFLGWFDSSGNQYTNGLGQSLNVWNKTKGTSMFPKFESRTFTISYDTNSGSIESTTQQVRYGGYYILPTPTRTGYTFIGWQNEAGDTFTRLEYTILSDISLTAVYQANTYTVTLSGYGTNYHQDITYNTAYELPVPTKTGYTFNGWFDENNKKYTNLDGTSVEPWNEITNITLYPSMTPNTYTIMYNPTGGNIAQNTQEVTYDSNVELLNTTRSGYTFKGWYIEEELITNGIWQIDHNITLFAHWEANNYSAVLNNVEYTNSATVFFDVNGGSSNIPFQTVTTSSGLYYPNIPVRSGYVFKGWYLTPDCTDLFDFSASIIQDTTVYAGWERISLAESPDYIILDARSYNPSPNYNLNTNDSSSSSPMKMYIIALTSGLHSIYYYNSSSGSTYYINLSITNVTQGTDILPNTIAKNGGSLIYNQVEFNANAGDVICISAYRENTNYQPNIYFYFKGFDTPAAGGKVYSLTYTPDEEIENAVSYGSEFNLPVVVRSGYTFEGWYDSENGTGTRYANESGQSLFAWNSLTSLNLYPNFIPNTYMIYYHTYGTSSVNSTQEVVYDSQYELLAPTRKGYTFEGWFEGETEVTDGIYTRITNLTLYGRWVANQYTVTLQDVKQASCTVTFDMNWASGINLTQTISGEEKLSYPQIPTRDGYVFRGWFTTPGCAELFDFNNRIYEDTTIYAGWTQTAYGAYYIREVINPMDYNSQTNNYYLHVGQSSASQPIYLYFSVVNSGTYTIYYENGRGAAINFGTEYDIKNARTGEGIPSTRFVATNAYFESYVSYYLTEGDAYYLKIYNIDNFYTNLYLYFTGFSNKSIYTKSEQIYNEEDSCTTTMTYGENFTLPVVSRSGYAFWGWYDGEDGTGRRFTNSNGKGIGTWSFDSDVVLYPYMHANTYTITYDPAGGDVSNTTQQVSYNTSYELLTPSRSGYTFMGWYSGDKLIEDGIWTENHGMTLVAHWENNKYIVTLDNYRVGSNDYTQEVVYGRSFSVPAAGLKAGYTFDGWFDASGKRYTDAAGLSTRIWDKAENATLYASYLPNHYTITYYEDLEVTVSFNLNGGTGSIPSQTITGTEGLVYPNIPTRNGYVFTGWYTTADCQYLFDFSASVTNDITLYAGWYLARTNVYISGTQEYGNLYIIDPTIYNSSSNAFTVTTEDTGSSNPKYIYIPCLSASGFNINIKSDTAEEGTYCTIYSPQLAKTYIENTLYGSSYYSTVTISAIPRCQYVYISLYGISSQNITISIYITAYHLPTDGGKAKAMLGTQEVIFNEEYTLLSPTKEGYTFGGWLYNGNPFNNGTWRYYEDITLDAIWHKND